MCNCTLQVQKIAACTHTAHTFQNAVCMCEIDFATHSVIKIKVKNNGLMIEPNLDYFWIIISFFVHSGERYRAERRERQEALLPHLSSAPLPLLAACHHQLQPRILNPFLSFGTVQYGNGSFHFSNASQNTMV